MRATGVAPNKLLAYLGPAIGPRIRSRADVRDASSPRMTPQPKR
jgi:hypothetical protein